MQASPAHELPNRPAPSEKQQIYVLWWIAEQFLRTGRVESALKCLEAALYHIQRTPHSEPLLEIKTRLRITDLLLKYTQDLDRAKAHLSRAHLISNDLDKPNTSITHRILCHFATVFIQSGKSSQAKQYLKRGSELALRYKDSRWYYFYQMELSKISLSCEPENPDSTLENILAASRYAQNLNDHRLSMLFSLAEIQIRLIGLEHPNVIRSLDANLTAMEQQLYALNSVPSAPLTPTASPIVSPAASPSPTLSGLRVSPQVGMTQSPQELVADSSVLQVRETAEEKILKFYHCLLTVLYLQRLGQIKKVIALLPRLQQLLQSIKDVQGNESGLFHLYATNTFDTTSLWAVILLLKGISERGRNPLEAQKYFSQGLQLVEKRLRNESTKDKDGRYIVPSDRIHEVNILQRFKFLFLENQFYVHHMSCQYPQCIAIASDCMQIHLQFSPVLWRDLHIIHYMLGLLSSSLCLPSYATTHFELARQGCRTFVDYSFCLVQLGLSYCRESAPEKALALLQPLDMQLEAHPVISIRAAKLFVQALAAVFQTRPQEAKAKMLQCLTITKDLMNEQLSAQVLAYGALVYLLDNDTETAEKMLQSAIQRATITNDSCTKADILRITYNMHIKLQHGAELANKTNFAYSEAVQQHKEGVTAARMIPALDILNVTDLVAWQSGHASGQ